jgi:hypothetical protein
MCGRSGACAASRGKGRSADVNMRRRVRGHAVRRPASPHEADFARPILFDADGARACWRGDRAAELPSALIRRGLIAYNTPMYCCRPQ